MATIEIDGKIIETEAGKMIIEVADDNDIFIPRFCYHKKLSVAANCRMCLVEVAKSRKPLPACATPITDGMKVMTKSKLALEAQRIIMEFLLINHPLDCPICDQGGECELQDVSMGYGEDYSHYEEAKRSVDDDDLGPLISTDMTRCIHCTRCIRFGDEIAGVRELGATFRGEHTKIGTYIKHSMTSEVSANIIDLCPVGALTNKPFRFTARSWELTQHPAISPFDSIGSNLFIHTRRNSIMRSVPKDNEAINENWIADRDRFGILGANSKERLLMPMIKKDGQWQQIDWQSALQHVSKTLNSIVNANGGDSVAALAHPSASTEELYLMQKFMRAMGSNNIDHRIQQTNFDFDASEPQAPIWQVDMQAIEDSPTILLLGSNIHQEQPLAGLRVRKAALNDARIFAINTVQADYHFNIFDNKTVKPSELLKHYAQIAKALLNHYKAADKSDWDNYLSDTDPSEMAQLIAKDLKTHGSLIIVGAGALNSPYAADIKAMTHFIARCCGANVLLMTPGGNSAGAWLAGAVPHRRAGGQLIDVGGDNAKTMFDKPKQAYILQGIEPSFDLAHPRLAQQAFSNASCVIALSAFDSKDLREHADVLLPITPFTESSGTYVNALGNWQDMKASCKPQGESRPAWKVWRVLANFCEFKDFEYLSSTDILSELKDTVKALEYEGRDTYFPSAPLPNNADTLETFSVWPIYRIDAMVRRAEPLQRAALNTTSALRFNQKTHDALKQHNSDFLKTEYVIDETIADHAVMINRGFKETAMLD